MTRYSDLQDKVVLITGGANGIGRAMVRQFAEQDARVFFCDIDVDAGKSLRAELAGVNFRKVNLIRETDICKWIERVAQDQGRIDVLINNAARDPRIAIDEMTVKQWDELFALNIRAFVIAIQHTVPHMPKGSSIINFSSITHHLSPAEMSAYVSTKSGIIGLTRSLSRELGPLHIRVNTLAPGWIMTERQLQEFVTPAVKKMLKKEQCIPELLRPEEIASVALFLASSASSAITGQELLADRGWAHS